MAAESPLENSQVECELFRMCGECAEHEATPPSNRQAEWPRRFSVQQTFARLRSLFLLLRISLVKRKREVGLPAVDLQSGATFQEFSLFF